MILWSLDDNLSCLHSEVKTIQKNFGALCHLLQGREDMAVLIDAVVYSMECLQRNSGEEVREW